MNNSSQAKRALVVFSGGQDSTTCLYWALKHFEEVRTLTFDYGQRHRIELECAKKIAQFAAVHHEVLSVGTFAELGGNALTGSEDVKAHQKNIIEEGLPNTFVPGRNIILFSLQQQEHGNWESKTSSQSSVKLTVVGTQIVEKTQLRLCS